MRASLPNITVAVAVAGRLPASAMAATHREITRYAERLIAATYRPDVRGA